MIRLRHILATVPAVILLVAAGCKKNPDQTKMQYVPDMADTAAIKSQRDYLQPPEGSVALSTKSYKAVLMNPGKGPSEFPKPYATSLEESEKIMENPVKNSPEVVAKGKVLWSTFCVPCHGSDGAGVGSITDAFVQAPTLLSDINRTRKDGFIFHKITFGGAVMPSYGHAISAEERWTIIHYIRDLQKAAQ